MSVPRGSSAAAGAAPLTREQLAAKIIPRIKKMLNRGDQLGRANVTAVLESLNITNPKNNKLGVEIAMEQLASLPKSTTQDDFEINGTSNMTGEQRLFLNSVSNEDESPITTATAGAGGGGGASFFGAGGGGGGGGAGASGGASASASCWTGTSSPPG